MFAAGLFLIPIFSLTAHAANDWAKPCFQGSCSYDFHPSSGSSGTLKVWGSKDTISDITRAAGWEILGCKPDALAQDIRIVCKSHDTSAAGCDHLFQSVGAVGKLVRLPEDCGKSAFARVAKAWVPEDQSIPSHIASSLTRRAGVTPKVQALSLDTDFAAISPDRGNVSFAVQGTTIPNTQGQLAINQPRSRIQGRSSESSFVESAFDNFTKFDKNLHTSLPPIDLNKDIVLFDASISCPANGPIPAFSASAKADINGNVHAVVDIGVAVTGTVIPPDIKTFGLYAGLTASIDGKLTLAASATGSIDSGALTLYQTSLGGLDIPGIITVGPTLQVTGQAKAAVDAQVSLEVDLNYQINGATLYYPASSSHQSGGGFNPGDTPLKLSVSPSVTAHGTVEAHLTPTLKFGLSAFAGLTKADIHLDIDASANLVLSLSNFAKTSVSSRSETSSEVAKRAASSLNGCADLRGGLHINAGASASFFHVFDPSTTVPLYNKDFEIFKTCFNQKEAAPASVAPATALHKRDGLVCPGSGVSTAIPVIDQVISAGSIGTL